MEEQNKTEELHLRLYGDSLALPRKNYVANRETYIYLLKQWLLSNSSADINVINRSRANSTVKYAYNFHVDDNSYFEINNSDILIIHVGVCDSAPRPLPLWIRDIIAKLHWKLRRTVIRFLHNNRRRMIRSGFRFVNVSQPDFEKLWNEFLNAAIKISSRIYVINIAPTNSKTEFHSPGFSTNIQLYNDIISNTLKKISSDKIFLIDIYDLINRSKNIDEYITPEDGHHITARTHELIYEQILLVEKRYH